MELVDFHLEFRCIRNSKFNIPCKYLTLPAIPSQMHPEPQGGRFMPAPSRLTIITVKNQKNFFYFLKLYNELGKVKFFQVSII